MNAAKLIFILLRVGLLLICAFGGYYNYSRYKKHRDTKNPGDDWVLTLARLKNAFEATKTACYFIGIWFLIDFVLLYFAGFFSS